MWIHFGLQMVKMYSYLRICTDNLQQNFSRLQDSLFKVSQINYVLYDVSLGPVSYNMIYLIQPLMSALEVATPVSLHSSPVSCSE